MRMAFSLRKVENNQWRFFHFNISFYVLYGVTNDAYKTHINIGNA